jgi:hypothetical protein
VPTCSAWVEGSEHERGTLSPRVVKRIQFPYVVGGASEALQGSPSEINFSIFQFFNFFLISQFNFSI